MYYAPPKGYDDIVEGFGDVLLSCSAGSYQGTNYWLLRGLQILEYGYGSCSGCDSLEGCSSEEDFQRLCEDMRQAIHTEETPEALIAWLKDTKNHGDWDDPDFHKFVSRAEALLIPVPLESA